MILRAIGTALLILGALGLLLAASGVPDGTAYFLSAVAGGAYLVWRIYRALPKSKGADHGGRGPRGEGRTFSSGPTPPPTQAPPARRAAKSSAAPTTPWKGNTSDDKRLRAKAAQDPEDRLREFTQATVRYSKSDTGQTATDELFDTLAEFKEDEEELAAAGFGNEPRVIYGAVNRGCKMIANHATCELSTERLFSSLALLWEVAQRYGDEPGVPDPAEEWLEAVKGVIGFDLQFDEMTNTGRRWLERLLPKEVEGIRRVQGI